MINKALTVPFQSHPNTINTALQDEIEKFMKLFQSHPNTINTSITLTN